MLIYNTKGCFLLSFLCFLYTRMTFQSIEAVVLKTKCHVPKTPKLLAFQQHGKSDSACEDHVIPLTEACSKAETGALQGFHGEIKYHRQTKQAAEMRKWEG